MRHNDTFLKQWFSRKDSPLFGARSWLLSFFWIWIGFGYVVKRFVISSLHQRVRLRRCERSPNIPSIGGSPVTKAAVWSGWIHSLHEIQLEGELCIG